MIGQRFQWPDLLARQLHRTGVGQHGRAQSGPMGPQWEHHHRTGATVAQ